jgi:glycosyltransferase involved in cell wall biosynthesis
MGGLHMLVNKMKKIVYLNDLPLSLGFGGKEVQLLQYKSIIERNFENGVISFLDFWEKDFIEENTILHLFGSGKWFHNIMIQAISNKKIKKIIVSPTFYVKDTWKLKIASYLSRINPLKDQISYKQFIFDNADVIVVNSKAEANLISYIFGKHLISKIEMIPNVVSETYMEIDNKNLFLEKYSLEPNYILSVGFLDERKNSINMIKAFLNFSIKNNKKLVLIGGMRFINKHNALEAEKLILTNKDKIINIPFIKQNSEMLKSAYCNCAIHILPSFVETPGIANLEAMIFNKPIVVGECIPVREYFKDNAIYCDQNSIDSISKSIVKAIESINDKSNNVQYILNNYTDTNIVSNLKAIYN